MRGWGGEGMKAFCLKPMVMPGTQEQQKTKNLGNLCLGVGKEVGVGVFKTHWAT